MFDFSLLTSPTFIVLGLAGFMSLMALFIPFMFLPGKAIPHADMLFCFKTKLESVQSVKLYDFNLNLKLFLCTFNISKKDSNLLF